MSSVTVTVPMTIRRRGGRKQIIGPDGSPVQAGEGGADIIFTRGDPALVKALARGFRWRRMLEEGRYASIRELAAAEQVDRAYVGRVLNMTLMAPEVVEEILDGRVALSLPSDSANPAPWLEQRRALGCMTTPGRKAPVCGARWWAIQVSGTRPS